MNSSKTMTIPKLLGHIFLVALAVVLLSLGGAWLGMVISQAIVILRGR